MASKRMSPIHPGEVLLEELMQPLAISQNELARNLGVSPTTINQLVQAKRDLTADVALRLARCFKMSADFWMGLQKDYDLERSRDLWEDRIKKEVKIFKPKKHSNELREENAMKIA